MEELVKRLRELALELSSGCTVDTQRRSAVAYKAADALTTLREKVAEEAAGVVLSKVRGKCGYCDALCRECASDDACYIDCAAAIRAHFSAQQGVVQAARAAVLSAERKNRLPAVTQDEQESYARGAIPDDRT